MRFLVDECVPIEITKELQARNFDIYDPRLKNTRGMDDSAIIELASSESRIIITRDLDSNLISITKKRILGIIILRFRTETKVSTIVKFFKKFLLSYDLAKCQNSIVVISPSGIRIRRTYFP